MRIGLTEVFRSATSFASLDRKLLQQRLLLTLYGLGTNTGLKRIANGQPDTDYKDLLYVRRRYVTKEQLREAIRLVVNAIFATRDPRIWGEGTTACASDSKKFGAWDQNLMTEWHARYGGRGVMVYWHVEKKSACIYSQLKTCSSSEVASMIEGVLRHCTEMEVDRNYVDTHGQSEVAFAFCRLLGFQLLPRLKAIHSQKLHPAEAGGKTRYPNLAPVLANPIDWDLIEAEYNPFVRYATGLRLGTANAEDILRRFTRNNAQHPTYRALTELGQACKTIFLCRYLRQAALRREIHEGLQVIENWNGANGFIYFARGGEFASNRVDDQEIAMLSLHLLQICLVYINTLMIQRILAEPEWRDRLTATDRRGLTPLVLTHINPYGIFELDMNTRLPLDPPRHRPGSARGQMWLYDEQIG
jgi:TnpA family transposase